MSIIAFHRFLIGTAILFCALFAAWEASAFLNSGDWLSFTLAVTFGVATVALVYYLANLDRFLDRRRSH